jgi:hypothetical protein
MTAPVIYDVTTDSFRPVTQAEVNAMIARLNGNSPVPIFTQFAAGAPSPTAAMSGEIPDWMQNGFAGRADTALSPKQAQWSDAATMAAR